MLRVLIFLAVPIAIAQIPVYLRTPALASPIIQAAPVAQLQCSQQCMPSCLPSCLVAQQPAINYQPVAPVANYYQAYGAGLAYYKVAPVCASACMPTCAPSCVATPSSPTVERDDLPTPPPEIITTPQPELSTTIAPTDVVPCKCLIKITITQGNNTISKCGPNSCACPKGYSQCGSNCCRK